MKLVIDTDVINYHLKNDPTWTEYEKILKDNGAKSRADWVLCFATAQELLRWSLEQKEYHEKILEFIKSCVIAPVTLSGCQTAALLRQTAGGERRWHDIWIAATAIDNNLPLVTNNAKDYRIFETKFKLKIFTAS